MTEQFRPLRLNAVYKQKFEQWMLVHNQFCQNGETSVVATVLVSGNPTADAKWAADLADAFNTIQEANS